MKEFSQPGLTGIVWTVLDESRELCENVSANIEGLFVERAEVRIPAGERRKGP